MARYLSPGIIAAIVVLVILLLVAIALAIYFGVRSSQNNNYTNCSGGNNCGNCTGFTGPAGPTGPTGPIGPTGPAGGSTSPFGTAHSQYISINLPVLSGTAITTAYPVTFNTNYLTSLIVDLVLPGGPYNGALLNYIVPPNGQYNTKLPVQYDYYIANGILYLTIYGYNGPVAGNTATLVIRAYVLHGLVNPV